MREILFTGIGWVDLAITLNRVRLASTNDGSITKSWAARPALAIISPVYSGEGSVFTSGAINEPSTSRAETL
jgi:hypothetical protein